MNFWKNTPVTNKNRKFRPKPFCSPSPLQSKDIFPRLFRDVHCPSWSSVRTTDFTTPPKNPVFGAFLGLFKRCRVSSRKSHMWCSDLYEGDLFPGIVQIHGFWYFYVSWHMTPKTDILTHFSFGPISSTALRPAQASRIR